MKTTKKYQIPLSFDTLKITYAAFAECLIVNIMDDYSNYFKGKNMHFLEKFDIKNIFNKRLKEILNNIETQKITKLVPNKPSIPVPFYGQVEENWCRGVKKNHGLYTQCTKSPQIGIYCKVCERQSKNNATTVPNCGNIDERKRLWNDELDYQPDGMSKEIPYANIMKKLEITRQQAEEEVNKMGWDKIPNCHFVEKKVKRGRPSKTKIVVSDSDEDIPKRKRGRPIKHKGNPPTDEELFMFSCTL